jgi:hypothetical protein
MIKNPTTFNDIENVMLKTYNRAQMALNLANDNGLEDVQKYFAQFSDVERAGILTMLLAIKQNPEDTLRQVRENANIQ